LVRRHAVELAIGQYRWAICLYGIANARSFVSAFAEIAPQPIELQYHPDADADADAEDEDDDETFVDDTPPVPRR
ncbi:hypothetical protein L0M97_14115, partial [[Ruminococcus] torques]|uniref:hypothetical protein n=1 Tax=[Ruminococcus] torques TaxID=33039 RepID=UPI001EDEDD3A